MVPGLEERDLPLRGLWPQEIKKFKLRRDKMRYVQNNSVLLLPGHSGPANSPAAVTRVLSFWVSLETHHLDRQERQMSVHKTHFSCF